MFSSGDYQGLRQKNEGVRKNSSLLRAALLRLAILIKAFISGAGESERNMVEVDTWRPITLKELYIFVLCEGMDVYDNFILDILVQFDL